MLRPISVILAVGLAFPVHSRTVETSAGPMTITQVASGLDEPWAIDFLPDGGFLVTERAGRIKLFAAPGAEAQLVAGVPQVGDNGQGGLLDIMLPRDFASARQVFLTYAQPSDQGEGTAVGRATLSPDGLRLEGFQMLFAIPKGATGGRHFGSRLVEAPDGTIFVTVGDRGTGPEGQAAQDLQRGEGKIFHLTRDGQPATRLPDALPGIYSWGHRNPQGAALDREGRLWAHEHGARGGDELNLILPGRNYGWPVITYGVNYNGQPIGEGQTREGMEQPVHYWDPSIAPSGMVVYSGALIPDWQGDILFGSLNSDFLGRLDPDTPAETGFAEERIATAETGRVRDVVEAPDGSIWFLSVTNGAAYRLAP